VDSVHELWTTSGLSPWAMDHVRPKSMGHGPRPASVHSGPRWCSHERGDVSNGAQPPADQHSATTAGEGEWGTGVSPQGSPELGGGRAVARRQ
jgi:hypothetical protein